MKKLIAFTLAATSVAVALTAKTLSFELSYIGEDFVLVRDDNGETIMWDIHRKNSNHYVFKKGRKAILLPINLKVGDTIKLYSVL